MISKKRIDAIKRAWFAKMNFKDPSKRLYDTECFMDGVRVMANELSRHRVADTIVDGIKHKNYSMPVEAEPSQTISKVDMANAREHRKDAMRMDRATALLAQIDIRQSKIRKD